VVSFGRLGILGRTGWYCGEADVEHWNALAGYRGLKDPAVRQCFNGTFLAFEKDWGGYEEIALTNLGLRYDVAYLGAEAAPDAIRARLDAGIPPFFYLWTPDALNARYRLNRIQLPAYTPELFEQGLCDYPTDVLEKVAAKILSELVPDVAELYLRFQIDNLAQESMLATINSSMSAMQASCGWVRNGKNTAVWEAWLPREKLVCDAGHYAVDATSCAPCPPGSASIGGAATACVQCSAGARKFVALSPIRTTAR
jgi:glycine betaine/proline transport system substrate-binding protein